MICLFFISCLWSSGNQLNQNPKDLCGTNYQAIDSVLPTVITKEISDQNSLKMNLRIRTFEVQDFFNFEFDKTLSAADALNSDNFDLLVGTTGKTIYTVDENLLTFCFHIISENIKSCKYEILGYANGNKNAYLLWGEDFQGNLNRLMFSITEADDGNQYIILEASNLTKTGIQTAFVAKVIHKNERKNSF